MSNLEDASKREVMRKVLMLMAEMPFDSSPPVMSGTMHRLIREISGVKDPYATVKKKATDTALGMIESAGKMILKSVDPFEAALRLSIAGNILDFGAFTHIDDDKIEKTVKNAMLHDIDTKCVRELKARTSTAKSILFIGDNAGETVFDMLLIQRLPENTVRYAVKSGPVINDATLKDAIDSGIDSIAEILETGSDMPGTILEECSAGFLKIFNESDLVIAKGQANYETLQGCNRDVFHLMQVKCPVIARDTGHKISTWLVARNNSQQNISDEGNNQ